MAVYITLLCPKAQGSLQKKGQKDSKSQITWRTLRKWCLLDTYEVSAVMIACTQLAQG